MIKATSSAITPIAANPIRAPIERIKPIYKALCEEEARHVDAKEGMRASFDVMVGLLKQQGLAYDEFVNYLKAQAAAGLACLLAAVALALCLTGDRATAAPAMLVAIVLLLGYHLGPAPRIGRFG